MVLVRIKDKRCHIGYKIKFFKTDTITDEVIQFIKNHPKAYWVECGDKTYHNREELKEVLNPRKRKFLGLESEVFKYETFSNILYGKRNI